jgi:hypothetical protein
VAAPSRAALADWTVLMLAPLPFSPWLEPYHGVPVVPGTILCLVVAPDTRATEPDRIIVAAALSVLLAMHAVRIPLPIRGLQLLVQFLVLIIAFGLVRPRLTTDPSAPWSPWCQQTRTSRTCCRSSWRDQSVRLSALDSARSQEQRALEALTNWPANTATVPLPQLASATMPTRGDPMLARSSMRATAEGPFGSPRSLRSRPAPRFIP